MANEIFDESQPANTEGVKLGAQRFRELKTTLNLLMKQFWSDPAGTLKTKSVSGAMIANDAAVDANRAIGTDHIKDGAVTGPKLSANAALPAGAILPYAGSSAPSSFLFCAGQSVLRADYAALFTAIGTSYGSVDGTHFTLPDLRGRVPFALDNMNGAAAGRITRSGTVLGSNGGEELHTLTTPEIPAHTHTIPSDTVQVNTGSGATITVEAASAPHGGATTPPSGSTGGGGSHENMPPYLLVNYIIKT